MAEALRRRSHGGAVAEAGGPVFIVGAPRSGTTALGRALSNHSDFWTSEETYILYPLFGDGRLAREFERWRNERASATWLKAQDVSLDEFLRHIGNGLAGLFGSRSWGKRWIDHTPHHVLMVGVLASMFPDARFVHVLRDGRAVVNSMIHVDATLGDEERARMRAGNFLPQWSSDFRTACREWRDSVDAALNAAQAYPQRCLTVRQEELTSDPEATFRRLFEFLGAAYESRPVEYWRSNRINSSFSRSGRSRVEKSDAARAWAAWPQEQRAIFTEEAGEALVRFGYAEESDDGN